MLCRRWLKHVKWQNKFNEHVPSTESCPVGSNALEEPFLTMGRMAYAALSKSTRMCCNVESMWEE